MDLEMSSEDFIQFLSNFHDAPILRQWAIQNHKENDPHVKKRIKEIIDFQAQRERIQAEHLWNLILESYTTGDELIQFAERSQCLYDLAVQRRLAVLRKVCKCHYRI